MKHVASCSFGKDSLAMCLLLIEGGYQVDEIVFYDTGMEFNAIYKERDRFVPYFNEHGIKFTELYPSRPFMSDMFLKPVTDRKTGITTHGYGWCGGVARWGTTFKNDAINKHIKKLGLVDECVQYVGIAFDEKRKRDSTKLYPLDWWQMTEQDCLDFCYEHGAEWDEDGVKLYDVLDRVSCWCCRNKNKKELKAMHDHLPYYFGLLEGMEDRLGQMKDKPLWKVVSE